MTVMTNVMVSKAGQSDQGTFEPVTPVLPRTRIYLLDIFTYPIYIITLPPPKHTLSNTHAGHRHRALHPILIYASTKCTVLISYFIDIHITYIFTYIYGLL